MISSFERAEMAKVLDPILKKWGFRFKEYQLGETLYNKDAWHDVSIGASGVHIVIDSEMYTVKYNDPDFMQKLEFYLSKTRSNI